MGKDVNCALRSCLFCEYLYCVIIRRLAMCLGGGSSPPPPDKALEAEQEQKREEAIADKKEIKQDALEKTVARRKGGTGRRSLIKGSGGGMGFYNKYLS